MLLVIDRKHTTLSYEAGRLRMDTPGEKPRFVPLRQIDRVVITTSVHLHSQVLSQLTSTGASLLLLSSHDHRRGALLLPPGGGDHRVRLRQYEKVTDREFRQQVALRLVRMKLHGQYRMLQSLPSRHGSCRRAMRNWPGLLRSLPDAENLDAIRGLEGGAASLYFSALADAAPASWGFTGRKRRPPPDPLNAALSLSYTLLHSEACHVLLRASLDPMLGFLHAPEYHRESLACDCVEPLRPAIDRWVWHLFHSRRLRVEHFRHRQGACLLGKAGRAPFYAAWASEAPRFRRELRGGVRILKRAITEA